MRDAKLMTHTIQPLEGELIVVVTFTGSFGAQELGEFMPQAVEMQRESGDPLYWIIDLRATWSDFAQIIDMIAHQSRGTPGTATNAPGRVFLVGSTHVTHAYTDGMRQPQFGGLDIPIFADLEAALTAVRRIARGDSPQDEAP